ncbi:MAG: hypothetical protein ACXVZ2_08080 [Gaiellaceae bacterium]
MLALPVAIVVARRSAAVSLLEAVYSFPLPILLGVLAIQQARRAQERIERTLGRAGGAGQARWGRRLGVVGIAIGVAAGLALAFYALLAHYSG